MIDTIPSKTIANYTTNQQYNFKPMQLNRLISIPAPV